MSLTTAFGKNQDLEDDTTDIERILNSGSWYPLEHVREESYYEDGLIPSRELPDRIVQNIRELTGEDILEKWQSVFVSSGGELTEEEYELTDYLINLRNVLSEASVYQHEEGCYTISAYFGSHFYGSICVFLSTNEESYALIQGITKSLSYSLISYLYPGKAPSVRLNEVLIPEVERFCKSRGIDTIYVAPIGKQERILLNYYGFERTDVVPAYPNSVILGSPESHANHSEFLYKRIE